MPKQKNQKTKAHSCPFRITFDLDDVLIDLVSHWVSTLNKRHGLSVDIEDIKDWAITRCFPTLAVEQVYEVLYDEDFWKDIQPREGAQETIKKLSAEGYEIWVCTNSNYQTIKMKVDRVLSLFPELSFDRFIITKNKQLVKCNVLIDDGTHNLEKGEYYRLLMDRPWNRDYNEEKNGILRVCDFNDIYNAITKISKL